MIERRDIQTGGRMVYRPADIIPWVKGRTVAVIGDGPSKRKYIFAPDRVISFAVNKAAITYPRSVAAVVGDHFDDIMVQLPPWVPMLYFGAADIMRYNVGESLWTVVVLTSFLSRYASTVYLQGLDMSNLHYAQQVPVFRAMVKDDRFPKMRNVRLLNGGPLSEVFPTKKPKIQDIC
jgi:hypothetical protein